MRTTVLLTAGVLIFSLAAPAFADDTPVTKVAATECAAMAALRLPDVAISAATAVPAADKGRVRVPHCKVTGVISTEIRFDVLLPDTWNRRFAMGGGGGFVGSVQNQFVDVVNRGYATAGTDTGHQSPGMAAGWALANPERQINYGFLGVHRTAEVAKAIVRAYYGSDSAYSYFLGCSNGGRQALMEAQRYPADFDGIVSGAPAYDFTRIAASFVTHAKATFPDPSNLTTSTVSPADLALVASAALDSCDIADGVKDAVIDQPSSCRFSLDRVKACPNDVAAADCLTTTSRAALARIYAPIVGPAGEIYPGQPVGGEADRGGWLEWITGASPRDAGQQRRESAQCAVRVRHGVLQVLRLRRPAWDYRRFDVATWAADTRVAATILNADSVDLSAFKQRKGKLLLWHGWADAALNAQSTINYYERLKVADPHTPDYARLFLMPGVLHCMGGAGPDSVEWIDAIAGWTEKGDAPDRVIATKRGADGAPTRTRPLCPHPQRAVYNGTGSPDDAASFTCKSGPNFVRRRERN